MLDLSLKVGAKVDTSDIQAQLNKMTPKANVTTRIRFDGKDAIKSVTDYTDGLNNLVRTTKITSTNGEELSNTITKVKTTSKDASTSLDKASKSAKDVGDNFNHSSREGKNLGSQFVDITKKVLAFGTVTQVIMLFRQGISEAIEIVKEFDKAITEFSKVSDYSRGQINNYAKSMDEMAESVARTRTEFLDASTEFKKSGYTEEQSAQLAKVAGLYQNIADEQISAGEASSFIISQMKSFNITANEATSIIDRVNQVSNEFSVSSTDISSALTKTSSAMSILGNDMNETIGLVVSGTEIMTGQASKVGRGLRTIGNNIANLANKAGELSYSINGTTKTISLLDETTGDMKSTFDVLKDIKIDWNDMSKAEQQAIGIALAGKNQFEVFGSVLSNFNQAISASATAMKSQGSAMEENSKYMQSLEARISILRMEFEKLVLGDGGLSNLLKMIVNTGIAILKFANSDIGQAVIKVIAFLAVVRALTEVLIAIKGISVLSAIINTLSASFKLATISTEGFTVALNVLHLNPIILGITALITVLYIAKKAIDSQYEAIENLEKSTKNLSEELKSLKEIENPSQEEKNRIKYLEKRIELEEQLLEVKKRQLSGEGTEGKPQSVSDYAYGSSMTPITGSAYAASQQAPKIEEEKQYIDSTKSAILEYRNLQIEIENTTVKNQKELDQWEEKVAKLGELESALRQEQEILREGVDASRGMADADYRRYVEITNLIGILETQTEEEKIAYENLELLAEEIGLSTEELQEQAIAMGLTVEQFANYYTASQEIASQNEEINSSIDGMQSALSTATKAFEEYSESGSVTLDTFQDLLSISPEYLSALINENGQISLNEERLSALVEQLKITKIEELQNAAAADILALASGNVSEMSETAKGALADMGANIVDSGNKALTATDKLAGLASSVFALVKAGQGEISNETLDSFKAESNAIIDAYTKVGEKLVGIGVDISSSGEKSAKKSAKKTTDTYKEEYDKQRKELDYLLKMNYITEEDYYRRLYALNEKYFGEASGQHEKYIDDYRKNEETLYKGIQKMLEDRIKSIEDGFKKQIDYIKDAKDEELDAIDDQIDAIEKEKKAKLDSIDKQIDAVKKQRDEAEKYWDAQIDALQKEKEILDEQNKLMELQEELAKAKSKRVLALGESGTFEYREDEQAVSKAEQDLVDYEEELRYQEKLEQLELYKQQALAKYDSQIADLENYREREEESYDRQIENLEEHREQRQEYYDAEIEAIEQMVDDFTAEQERLLDEQLMAIDSENTNWETRLENLAKFVSEYNKIISQLNSSNTSVKSKYSGTSSKDIKTEKYASGIGSVKDDEIAFVGDNPSNNELVIGNKLNKSSGQLFNLKKGSGVVNAKTTNSLADNLTNLVKYGGLGNDYKTIDRTSNVTQQFNFGSIQFPNITNDSSANSLISALKNEFGNYVVQYGGV